MADVIAIYYVDWCYTHLMLCIIIMADVIANYLSWYMLNHFLDQYM